MQWVNLHYAIYSKTGSLLVGPHPGNTLFPGLPNCGTLNRGDPIVLYDQFAGRWMANQFAFVSSGSGPFYQCIAVSNTNDPTGAWCAYEFLVHPVKFNDYPEVRHLADSEHVHDDGAAVQLDRRPGRLGLRARQDARLPDGRDGLPGHGHSRPDCCHGSCRPTPTVTLLRPRTLLSRSSPTMTTAPGSRTTGST